MTCQYIQNLINYGIDNGLISSEDEFVIRNQLMDIMKIYEWDESICCSSISDIDTILKLLVDDACERGIISDTTASKDLFDTKLMGILTPLPSEVNRVFRDNYSISPQTATDNYYDFSKKLNYVRAGRMKKDIRWQYNSDFGTLDITINRSKPEKDPRDIATAGCTKSSAYPKCQLCAENAGFAGNPNHPARQNLRPVSVKIYGEEWQLQFSPYGYYNEHCILFNKNHTPMIIDRAVFSKLFDATELFPHYFFGSNADLPIVGGSILSHEHFQGGRYTFAMEKAPAEFEFTMEDFPEISAATVKWNMSVIRLSSENREQLGDACGKILERWRHYSDESVGIFAETDGQPHNTITPIARKNGNRFICDLVLRNNRTSAERPLGIFHPNPKLHHIKKENIGLIEVMGLAVLPSRLVGEMEELKCEMLSGNIKNSVHSEWAIDILKRHTEFDADNADDILKQEIGAVFEDVLRDCGVFKRDTEGTAAFRRFIRSIQD